MRLPGCFMWAHSSLPPSLLSRPATCIFRFTTPFWRWTKTEIFVLEFCIFHPFRNPFKLDCGEMTYGWCSICCRVEDQRQCEPFQEDICRKCLGWNKIISERQLLLKYLSYNVENLKDKVQQLRFVGHFFELILDRTLLKVLIQYFINLLLHDYKYRGGFCNRGLERG